MLSLWSPLATLRWQRIGCRSLQALAVITCTLIVIPLWHGVLTGVNSSLLFLKLSTPYNGAILLTLGIALFRERLISRAMRLPFLAMLVGTFGAMTAVLITQLLPFDRVVCDLLRVVSEQITLLVVLGAFFLFARFRFSDLFIRHSLKVVVGGAHGRGLHAVLLHPLVLPIRGPRGISGGCPGMPRDLDGGSHAGPVHVR